MGQGTVNGIGERTGNANLMTIIPTLQLKMGILGVEEKLRDLTALSRFTDEQARQTDVPQRSGQRPARVVICLPACPS